MLKYPSLNILPVKFTILYSEKIGSHLKNVKTLEKRCVCVCVCVCVQDSVLAIFVDITQN